MSKMPPSVILVQAVILWALLPKKLGQGTVSTHFETFTKAPMDGNIAVRDGVLFQTETCPWVITKAEMLSRTSSQSHSRNTIKMTSQCRGRTGNHFVNLSQFLAMGYCCKSKLLELPANDGKFFGPDGDIFASDNRFFDFSTVDTMPLEEYHSLAEQPDVCRPAMALGGGRGYTLQGIHSDLLSCMNRVYLRGCEAAYMGAMVNTTDFCPAREANLQSASSGGDIANKTARAGSLAVHIRSGDIFNVKPQHRGRYGQPPLQFYIDVITNKPWSEVSVMTFSTSADTINPTYTALQDLKSRGLLEPDVKFHLNRSFAKDIETMLCADGLAFARSSLALMTSAHARALYLYVPLECGPGTYTRESRTNTSPKVVQDNTTLLAIEKPHAEVYGIEWKGKQENYSVYTDFENTASQRVEMLKYNGIRGLKQCNFQSE